MKPHTRKYYLMMFCGCLSVALILASLITAFIMAWAWNFYPNSLILFIVTICVNLETLNLDSEMERRYLEQVKND